MKNKKSKAIALILAAIMACSATPAFAASTGSISTDTTVGEDTAQNAKTKYTETAEEGDVDVDVYLTIDDSGVMVGVPTEIIVSGTPDAQGNYKGEYSVEVEGDFAGNKTLTIAPDASVTLKQTGKNDVAATIAQIKTKFTNADILAKKNTSDGSVTAESLTAGSWSGQFTFNVSLKTA